MITDFLSLPINKSPLELQDQVLSLTGMTWSDYELLTKEQSHYRISFSDGVITIVSPSLNHESIERTISILIVAYCRQYNLLYFPMGSTTLKKPSLVGKEPDTSYSFNIKKEIPDLAVEVIYRSGNIRDLQKYKNLEIAEVWIWQNSQIKFYLLNNSQYIEVDVSHYLPNLSSKYLIDFINRGLTESPLIIEKDFIDGLS